MVINKWIIINNTAKLNGPVCTGSPPLLPASGVLSPEIIYHALQCNYPKFFKMDILCKWAWVATEYLFSGSNGPYKDMDKNLIAICFTTAHGCIEVDKRYWNGISIPSPALFVYTLPNIMLGEICIRHGFKGEQQCMVSERFDPEELFFTATGLLSRGMDACLCGWVDIFDNAYDICLFWVTKKGTGYNFTPEIMQQLYTGDGK